MNLDFIRELFKDKDKKTLINIGIAFVLGIILLLLSSSWFTKKADEFAIEETKINTEEDVITATESDYEAHLEKRMEMALSQIDGAGKVKVLLKLIYGREIIVAEDTTTNESISDDSDSRSVNTSIEQRKILITDEQGVSAPLVLREVQPKIEGVVIIAEGGDNVFVKDALTKAAETVLGLEVNKVQVFKMKPK
ncbi:MAG: hypothetical protein LBQ68_00745 [Clostridiales bacterium]|jgi:stage III sporulation protein AG|nr:hypothetical protein [Clostridiales bacterium]